MSVLVDAAVIIAFLSRRDRLHAEAERLMGGILEGKAGAAATTDYIVDEVLTFVVARGASERDLAKACAFLAGEGPEPGALALLRVGPDHFSEALGLVQRHRSRGLSFTDCTSLAVMRSAGLDSIATFDQGFEGLVPRFGADG